MQLVIDCLSRVGVVGAVGWASFYLLATGCDVLTYQPAESEAGEQA